MDPKEVNRMTRKKKTWEKVAINWRILDRRTIGTIKRCETFALSAAGKGREES